MNNKRILDFSITGQQMKKEGDFSNIVSGTAGYLVASFTCSSEWSGCRMAAVFSRFDKEYPVPIINGKCQIPKEITVYKEWKVQLIGEREEYRIVTNKVEVKQI